MSVVIHDGNPYWYLSPDIWVVPGSDPTGPPGSPVAGMPAYLWAHVSNTGGSDANGVRIDFYWANPALQVTRSNATLVGSAFADVPAGGAQDALCLVPWNPVIVNGGHECLVAVAVHPADPLPNPLPDAFDPPTYEQVAQKNLTVLVASMHAAMIALTISGLTRVDKAVTVAAELGGELDRATLASLGLRERRLAKNPKVEVGLARQPRCVGDNEPIGEHRLELSVPRGTSAPIYAAVRAKALGKDEYALVRIVERSHDREIGGFGLVIVAGAGKEQQS
jgi:hypothetical protein